LQLRPVPILAFLGCLTCHPWPRLAGHKSHDMIGNPSACLPRPALHEGRYLVMSASLSSGTLQFNPVKGIHEKGRSGMAFNQKDDKFLVADRKRRKYTAYDVSSKGAFRNKTKIISGIPTIQNPRLRAEFKLRSFSWLLRSHHASLLDTIGSPPPHHTQERRALGPPGHRFIARKNPVIARANSYR
jgi:hypothetical protein